MNKTTKYISIAALLILSGCTSDRNTHEQLNGGLWMQTSVEYQVACTQAYELAKNNVEQALNDKEWTAALEQQEGYQSLPPAVIFDVDETVLDNSPFQARLIKGKKEYNKTLWEAWVHEVAAEPIPGAKPFIQFLKSKGVKPFYVTNRRLEGPTLENIKKELDEGATVDNVLCKDEQPEWGSDKTSRRKEISKNYRIILLVGDDYNDFAYLGKVTPQERIKKAEEHKTYWGKKWIILTNPLYGSWEQAIYNYDNRITGDQKLKLKFQKLNTNGI